MTQIIKLKRSSTPGKVPAVNQLDFGEIGVNTADGKIYLKKDPGTGESIVTFVDQASSTAALTAGLATKMDLVSSAVTGNFPTLSATGGLVNSVYNPSSFATAAQGAKADTAVQPAANITTFTNNAGYITGISTYSINALADVNTAGVAPGQVLKWNGTAWAPGVAVDTNLVSSVFGRTGNVVAVANDYTAAQISYTDTNGLGADNVQSAISSLSGSIGVISDEIAPLDAWSHTHSNMAVLDLITDAGSGKIITGAERSAINSAIQPGNNITMLTNNANYISNISNFSINALSDVDTSGPGPIDLPDEGEVLTWDATRALWVPRAPQGAPGSNTVTSVFGRTGAVVALAPDYAAFYATVAQGAKADSAVQPGANNSIFVNNSGYITLAEVPAAPVASVFGRVGVVTAAAGDYNATEVDYNNAASGLVADNVQAAIDQLDIIVDANTASIATNTASIATNTASIATNSDDIVVLQNTAWTDTTAGSIFALNDVSTGAGTFNGAVLTWVDDGFGGGEWVPSSTASDLVTSVFGRTGNVLATAGDYDAAEVDYDNAASSLDADNVQDAIDELDANVSNIETQVNTNTVNIAANTADIITGAAAITVLENTKWSDTLAPSIGALNDVNINGIGNGQILVYDGTTSTFVPGEKSGVGATTFIGLDDTPASYAGSENMMVVVDPTASGLIFAPVTTVTGVQTIDVAGGLAVSGTGTNPIISAVGGAGIVVGPTSIVADFTASGGDNGVADTVARGDHNHALIGLSDVSAVDSANGSVLIYNDISLEWESGLLPVNNVGLGEGTIYAGHNSTDGAINLRTLTAGSNITLTTGTDDIVISATSSGIEEAPEDGEVYARRNTDWVTIALTALNDVGPGGDGPSDTNVLMWFSDDNEWQPGIVGAYNVDYYSEAPAAQNVGEALDILIDTSWSDDNPASLYQLSNVTDGGGAGARDTNVLTWNESSSAWEPAQVQGADVYFEDIGVVALSLTSNNVQGAIIELEGIVDGNTNNIAANTSAINALSAAAWTDENPAALGDLSDVDMSTPPTNQQALVWDNTNGAWIPGDVSGGTAGVTTFNGRNGAVDAAAGDYSSSMITNDSAIAGATVTTALDALNDGKIAVIVGGTENNFTSINASGGVQDSGVSVASFATTAQGALANTALQPLDNVSELTNDAGYITANAVNSVFGRTGVITAEDTDYAAFYATTAQGALADTALQPGDDISKLFNDANYLAGAIINTPVDTEVLTYNGTNWVNAALPATTVAADDVTYDNTTSGLTATEVQAAIDELDGLVDATTVVANTAIQPGDAVSGLVNDAGYVTATTAPVTSVFGRTGAVVAAAGDYAAFYATTAQGVKADSALQPTSSIGDLSDVDLTGVADGQVLVWDTNTFVAQDQSGAGEVNTASNLGAGSGVFAQKTGADLEFKSLVAGTNVTLASDANTVTINATAGRTYESAKVSYVALTPHAVTDTTSGITGVSVSGDYITFTFAANHPPASIVYYGYNDLGGAPALGYGYIMTMPALVSAGNFVLTGGTSTTPGMDLTNMANGSIRLFMPLTEVNTYNGGHAYVFFTF